MMASATLKWSLGLPAIQPLGHGVDLQTRTQGASPCACLGDLHSRRWEAPASRSGGRLSGFGREPPLPVQKGSQGILLRKKRFNARWGGVAAWGGHILAPQLWPLLPSECRHRVSLNISEGQTSVGSIGRSPSKLVDMLSSSNLVARRADGAPWPFQQAEERKRSHKKPRVECYAFAEPVQLVALYGRLKQTTTSVPTPSFGSQQSFHFRQSSSTRDHAPAATKQPSWPAQNNDEFSEYESELDSGTESDFEGGTRTRTRRRRAASTVEIPMETDLRLQYMMRMARAAREGNVEAAEGGLSEMRALGLKPGPKIHHSVICAYTTQGDGEGAVSPWAFSYFLKVH
jgi:hypothetical protein